MEFISRKTGCADDNNLIECLRKIPAMQLYQETFPGMGILKFPYIPVADGQSIAEMPVKLIKAGKVLRKDILLGILFNLNPSKIFFSCNTKYYVILVQPDDVGQVSWRQLF